MRQKISEREMSLGVGCFPSERVYKLERFAVFEFRLPSKNIKHISRKKAQNGIGKYEFVN